MGRAPGRVNLIGEHTDYNRGLCLPVAIPDSTTVAASVREDRDVRLRSDRAEEWSGSLDALGPGEVSGWAAYVTGVLWVLAGSGRELPGLDLDVSSTVPLGSGLSSSAALEAAVAVAVTGLLGEDLDDDLRAELAEVCRRAETEVVGAPTGGLDQAAVLQCPDGGALLLDFGSGAQRPVVADFGAAGLTLLVVDTRVSHAHADGGYGDRRAESEAATAALGLPSLRAATLDDLDRLDDEVLRRRVRHQVTENERVLACVAALEARDWPEVGRLFDASHDSLRDDYEVSCPELDLVVSTAREAGALGARMTGGGFGGSAIALIASERADAVRRAVDAAFVAAGFSAPGHLDGTPSAPASRVSG